MSPPTAARTAAARRASLLSRAKRRAADPDKRDHATLTVAAGLVTGDVTVDDLLEQTRRVQGQPHEVAQSAAAPDVDKLDKLRALLAVAQI